MATITYNHPVHGRFDKSLSDLHREIDSLVGGFDLDYTDLDRDSALIVLAFLTGDAAD